MEINNIFLAGNIRINEEGGAAKNEKMEFDLSKKGNDYYLTNEKTLCFITQENVAPPSLSLSSRHSHYSHNKIIEIQ